MPRNSSSWAICAPSHQPTLLILLRVVTKGLWTLYIPFWNCATLVSMNQLWNYRLSIRFYYSYLLFLWKLVLFLWHVYQILESNLYLTCIMTWYDLSFICSESFFYLEFWNGSPVNPYFLENIPKIWRVITYRL
jgi:hypothetical protein